MKKIGLGSLCVIADRLGVDPFVVIDKVSEISTRKLENLAAPNEEARAEFDRLVQVRRGSASVRITEV